MLCWSSKYSVAKNLSFISCLCKDHAGYFQESGLAPNQLQGRLMNVVFLCVSEEMVMNTSIISASFFFFFKKASLKDKQAEAQSGYYVPVVTKLLDSRTGI